MFTMLQDWSPKFSNINIKNGYLWEESLITTNLVWILKKDIDYISIDRWWSVTNSTDLMKSHVYGEWGLKTIQHRVISTITVQNPLLIQSYWINILWDRLWYNQNEKLDFRLNIYPTTPVMSLFTSYQIWQKSFLYNPDLSKTVLNFSYSNAWDKLLTNSVEVNRCVALVNQGTVHINSIDICENAVKNWTISKYKCDQDWDRVPDICDDDIDWDGVKNLIGIILYENKDCSISANNVNSDLLKKELWVCSLDNCPFASNSGQSDLNNNGIWERCEDLVSKLLVPSLSSNEWTVTLTLDKDQDWDGISDNVDACLDIPWNSFNGCPEYYSQNCWSFSTCWNWKVDEWENCKNCPQDVWVCCGNGILDSWESCKTCPADAGDCKLCGNGKIDKWEDCKNCEEDVWKCNAYCGNGEVELWRRCVKM